MTSAGCRFASRPVPVGLSASCVRLQRPCSAGYVCLLAFAMPCPLPSSFLPPFSVALPPCSVHVRQDRRGKLYRLSCWQLQHGPAEAARAPFVTFYLFFLQSP